MNYDQYLHDAAEEGFDAYDLWLEAREQDEGRGRFDDYEGAE